MVRSRLEQDIAALKTRFTVRYAADDRTVILEDVDLPDGFSPRTIEVRIQLPQSWPYVPPRIALPWNVRVDGIVPRQWLTSGRWLYRGTLGDPVLYFPQWEPDCTLEAVVETVLEELEQCGTSAHAMDDSDHEHYTNSDIHQS